MHILNTPPLLASCQNVVNWGRVAVMEVQAANSVVANEVLTLELISMDESLINHRMLLVQRYLQGIFSVTSNSMNQV